MSAVTKKKRIGLIGARGFVGGELLALLARDATCEVVFVTSKGAAGTQLAVPHGEGHTLVDLSPDDVTALVARGELDGVVLGLQNGQSAPWVKAFDDARDAGKGDLVVVDLSADHRFVTSDAKDGWRYGLVEKSRAQLRGARRIANPGCYSTAAQLALLPFHDIIERAHIFGVSGYSGAGSTPSKKNDVAFLTDNLLPYDLIGHTQEKEMGHQSGLDVRFLPHVAPFFRGIALTIAVDVKGDRAIVSSDRDRDRAITAAIDTSSAIARLRAAFNDERLVRVVDDEPTVDLVRGKNGVIIGGVRAIAGSRLVMVAVIDNLLKGAATQALQNLHLGLGVDEYAGIEA